MKTTKRNLLFAAVAVMVLGTAASAQAANGNLVADTDGYYIINDYADLKAFANRVNEGENTINGKLTADIAASDTSWTPIGNDEDHAFCGVFDGRGHTISGLDNAGATPRPQYAGLFGYVRLCTARNVGVVGGNIYAKGDPAYAGGIAGHLVYSTIENCFFSGSVTSDTSGYHHCAGGIAGRQHGGVVRNCHSTASLKGYNAGGIVGSRHGDGTVETCYFAGYRPSDANYTSFGPIMVRDEGTVSHCYYDSQKSSPAINGYISPTVSGAVGLLTQYFTDPVHFAGFDFDNIWYMGDSSPMLRVFLEEYPYADPADGAHPVKTVVCIPVTENTTTFRSDWYVASSNVRVSGRIAVDGEANLILGDGCTLSGSINLTGTNSLTVWCQGGGSGTLIANGQGDDAAIGGHGYSREAGSAQSGGALTIHGGTVTATARGAGAGIGGGGSGGVGLGDAGDGGMVKIDGGTVRAVSEGAGAGIGGGGHSSFGSAEGGKGGTVILNGGTVTAGSEDGGVAIGGGQGSGDDADGALKFAGCLGVVAAKWESHLASAQPVARAERAAACHSSKWAKVSPCQRDHASLTELCPVCGRCPPISYIDPADLANPEKTRTDCIAVFDDMEILPSGWYAPAGNLTLTHRLVVEGDVNLVLTDGTTLAAGQGIQVAAGDSLAIWGQAGQSGELIAENAAGGASIGGDENQGGGDIAIHGGTVVASTGDTGAQAIGRGAGGGDAGALALDGMRVFASATDTEPAALAQRESVCRGEWARLAPCMEHDYDLQGVCLICGLGVSPVSYLDPTQPGSPIRTVSDYALLTNQTTLTTGWHVVRGDAQIGERIAVAGNVNLILCDGANLTATKGFHVAGTNRLAIWGQSADRTTAGKLTATAPADVLAGIGGNNTESGGAITVNGGFVTAAGGSSGAGIGGGLNGNGGTITINGGIVTATGSSGAGIGGGKAGNGGVITINGGFVAATAQSVGAGIGGGHLGAGGAITINGGFVTASASRAQAVGHGYHGGDAGSLVIDGMRVFASASAADPVASAARMDTCRSAWARVEPCIAHGFRPDGQCPYCGAAIPLYNGQTPLTGGWHQVEASMRVETRIEVVGEAGLLLRDGVEFVAAQGFHVTGTNSLTIWGGSDRASAGTLTIPGPGDSMAGIGGNDGEPGGTVTVNGGVLDVTGGRKAGAIGGGRGGAGGVITVNGGFVTATGGELGTGLGGGMAKNENYVSGDAGSITINGGEVTATGGNHGAGIGGGGGSKATNGSSGGTVTINGGTVTATGGEGGAGIGAGRYAGSVTVVVCGGTVTAVAGDTAEAIGEGYGWSGVAGSLVLDGMRAFASTSATEHVTLAQRESVCRGAWVRLVPCTDHNGYDMQGRCLVCGLGIGPVSYLDPTDADSPIKVCVEHSSFTRQTKLTSGWYVAREEVQAPGRVEVAGDVHLLLCDGANLTASQGIHVASTNRLTIWGQGTDGTTAGKLTATAPAYGLAGIGGNNTESGGAITVNGGFVTATGGNTGAGIGGGFKGNGGDITINGGSVTATGGTTGAGIGGGFNGHGGNITINGGIVTATGGEAAGIGGGKIGNGGVITIEGGTVTANGGDSGAGIGGGYEGNSGIITIVGGTVTAVAGTDAQAIGGDNDWGGFAVWLAFDGMRVFASASAAEPVGAWDRESACRGEWAKVEVCPHEYKNGTCLWCGMARPVLAYAAWASTNNVTGAWNAKDAGGVHNVFRYAFDVPAGAFTNPPLLSISFDALGRAVIHTPPLNPSATGFDISILALDDLAGTGATTYPLDASGETVIPANSPARFFRLRAVEK